MREHIADYDAQSIFKKLVDHHLVSASARLRANDILSYLTTAKYSPQNWRGDATSFILHFVNQLDIYSTMNSHQDQLSDTMKRTLLENAVSGVSDLRHVKTTADLDIAREVKPSRSNSTRAS